MAVKRLRATWRLWSPMLLAPLFALAAQTVSYALAGALCEHQAGAWLHAVFAATLLIVLWLTTVGGLEWRRLQHAHGPEAQAPADTDRRSLQRLFLAQVATGVAAMSALAVAAMWLPQTMLSPCTA